MSYNEPVEVLCTLDICRFINENNVDLPIYPMPNHEINVKIGPGYQKTDGGQLQLPETDLLLY